MAENQLPRFLFVLALLLASGLTVLVVGSPWIDHPAVHPHGLARVTAVFARDATLRRTALASAVGLTVVAFVFFRSTVRSRQRVVRASSRPAPPPVVGA